MALLWDLNTNVGIDSRQDNRSTTNTYANTYVYSPYTAGAGATISGNKVTTETTARTDYDQTTKTESGFTGKNAQNTLIVVGAVGVLAVAGYMYLK